MAELLYPSMAGTTQYVVVSKSDGTAWSVTGSAFVALTGATWGDLDIAATQQGTKPYYKWTIPALPEGNYTATSYSRIGGSPADTDIQIYQQDFAWDGSAVVTLLNVIQPVGPGADSVVVDIKIGITPVANMQVWITSDAAGTVVVAGSIYTDVSGEVTFLLDYGQTYYLWGTKVGVNSIYGEEFVAAATNSFTTTAAAAAGTGLITLTQAREIVRNSVLHVPNGSYSDSQIDNAILFVGKMWMRDTKCVQKIGQVAITDGNREIDIQASLPDFNYWMFSRCQIVDDNNYIKTVARDDYSKVANAYCNSTQSGRPRAMGIKTNSTALLYPTPDDDYTLHIIYAEPFVQFTAGTLSPDVITINIPGDLVRDVLWFGAGTALVFGENYQNMYPTRGWAYFMELKKKVEGQMSIDSYDSYNQGTADWYNGNGY